MQDKRILITGGAGFIGINAAKFFFDAGWDVTLFDNVSRKGADTNLAFITEYTAGKCRNVVADVRTDTEQLRALAETNDVILHLAAQVAVTTSVSNPREDFEINALGTFNVLEAVRLSLRKPALLYASTNKVYGNLAVVGTQEGERRYDFTDGLSGVTEGHPLDFHSPYGCSKGTADQYVRDYARIYGLKTVIFRQSCIYGPHQFGIEDQGWAAWFLIAALLRRPITVYGNGKQVRDLLYIDDLIDVYAKAIDQIDAVAGQIYNIGGGYKNSLSLLEFFDILKNDFGHDVTYTFGAWRQGDQPVFISDNTKAYQELGWRPATDCRSGMRQLLDWIQDNKEQIEQFYR